MGLGGLGNDPDDVRVIDVEEPAEVAAFEAPSRVDRGLLVIHGAGTHERSTTLTELLNPTLSRMRAERTLVRVSPVHVGPEEMPGGRYDGLVVEYTKEPQAAVEFLAPIDEVDEDQNTIGEFRRAPIIAPVEKLLVVEGRWDRKFVDTSVPEVSTFIGRRASRMMWEVFIYHFRSLYAFVIAVATLSLLAGGIALSAWDDLEHDNGWGFFLITLGLLVAFVGALLDATAPWRDNQERVAKPTGNANRISWLWAVFPAFTMMVFHVQRGIVLLVTAVAMAVLPLVAFATRVIGTIPGLGWLSRGVINIVEGALLTGAPTDVEAIANNYVSAGAIQNRMQAALMEIESRLRPGSTITVLAHSAGAPIAWWLLSEPGIHERNESQPFRYRLITVGGALNWMRRGLECEATSLDLPLVNCHREPAERTAWLNAFSTWDPTPHGAVRRCEYKGDWESLIEVEEPVDPAAEHAVPRGGLLMKLRDAWSVACAARAPEAERNDKRKDPNVIFRNLGSPISAEHSEYFRNQQEFVPLLVTAIDPDVTWARAETKPKRRERWANARLAMLSGLVRARMVVFALPVAYLLLIIDKERIFTTCESERERFEGSGWLADAGNWVGSSLNSLPVIGGESATSPTCDRIWIEDIVIIIALALIAYALVEVYTNFCWAVLGRRVQSLDPSRKPWDPSEAPKRLGAAPLLGLLLLWVPTLLLPLIYLPFRLGESWYVFLVANSILSVAEAFWFDRCLRGVGNADAYAETSLPAGRYAQPAFI